MNNEDFIRLFVSPEGLQRAKETLISLLSTNEGKNITMIEAILIKDLFEIGLKKVLKK